MGFRKQPDEKKHKRICTHSSNTHTHTHTHTHTRSHTPSANLPPPHPSHCGSSEMGLPSRPVAPAPGHSPGHSSAPNGLKTPHTLQRSAARLPLGESAD